MPGFNFGRRRTTVVSSVEARGPRPTVISLVLGSVPQIQSIALSKCSLKSLFMLARVSKSVREVALRLINERRVNITVKERDDAHVIFDVFDMVECTTYSWKVYAGNIYAAANPHGSFFFDVFVFLVKTCKVNTLEMELIELKDEAAIDMKNYMHRAQVQEIRVKKLILHHPKALFVFLLDFLSPSSVELQGIRTLFNNQRDLRTQQFPRGLCSAKNIACWGSMNGHTDVPVDDLMMSLKASTIKAGVDVPSSQNSIWSHAGVAGFIAQWIEGERVIHKVSCLVRRSSWISAASFTDHFFTMLSRVNRTEDLVEDLYGVLPDGVEQRLMYHAPPANTDKGWMDVVRVNRSDGRSLVMVVRAAAIPKELVIDIVSAD